LPFPSPGDLLDPRIKPRSLALQADSLPPELSGKPIINRKQLAKIIYIYTHMHILTKEARIYNGLKTISLTSGAGKTGQPLVKE